MFKLFFALLLLALSCLFSEVKADCSDVKLFCYDKDGKTVGDTCVGTCFKWYLISIFNLGCIPCDIKFDNWTVDGTSYKQTCKDKFPNSETAGFDATGPKAVKNGAVPGGLNPC